ncbi:MAG: LysR family transcriptional regulator [Methyloceanibacter sp.]|uniref:LysR family transcriptional regulator n=1 Tax=Methyloceanibacter sp. TaxID=1965321 RepID=UPI003EDFD09E
MLRSSSNFSRNVDWNLLKTFHEIVEARGVSRAGRALRRKQPALSLALKRLEDALDVKLCRRGPRGFELTDEGMLVAETCDSLNALVRSVPKRLSNITADLRGKISIQIISSLVCERFDAAISRFHDQHPKVEILVDVTTWDSVAAALLRDEIDVGVASAQTLRSDLHYDFLFDELHGAYCGRSHPLFGKTADDPAALSGQAFVLTGADEPDMLTAYRTQHGLGIQVAGLSEHLDEAKRLTMLGIGVCFLPEAFAAPEVAAGRLWPLLKEGEQPTMPIFVITNPRAPQKLARQLLLTEIGFPRAAK